MKNTLKKTLLSVLSLTALSACGAPSSASSSYSSAESEIASSIISLVESASSSSETISEESTLSTEEKSSLEATSYEMLNTREEWSEYVNGSYTNYIDMGEATSFRLAPRFVTEGDEAECYFYDKNLETFRVGKTIYKDEVYTNSSDICLYYNAFHELPKNYIEYTSSRDATEKMKQYYPTFGDDTRLWCRYARTNGYVTAMPKINTSHSDFHYLELDLAYEPNNGYAKASGVSRSKAGRIVIFPHGTIQYGEEVPFCVKTLDHYGHFREFANYLDGWSANFDGAFSDLGNGPRLGSYESPLTTVEL